MIDYTYKDLFNQDSIEKEIKIICGDLEIDNDDIRSESMEIHESLCESNSLEFGSCEANSIKIDISRDIESVVGKDIVVKILMDGADEEWFTIGHYTVVSEKPSNVKAYKTITAYDKLYSLSAKDVTEWYKGISNVGYIKTLRDSFFSYCGIDAEETTLINDTEYYMLQDFDTVSALDVIRSICEVNGVFGNIDRDGVFRFVSLKEIEKSNLYPALTLFPANDLFPGDYTRQEQGLIPSLFTSIQYEEYKVQKITKITAEVSDGTATYGTDGNTYAIRNPLIIAGRPADSFNDIFSKMLNKIGFITYQPIKKLIAKGNPCAEVGDAIKVLLVDDEIFVDTYMLSRTLKGTMSLYDEYAAKGTEYQPEIKPQTSKSVADKTNRNTKEIEDVKDQLLKIQWVASSSAVGSDPYTFYCIKK